MRRRTSLLALVALLAVLFVPNPVSAGPGNPGADEARFVSLVNARRASQGIAPLQVDGQLTALARNWAAHQLGGGCGAGSNICHASSLSAGVSANWVKLGENVGTGPSVDAIMAGFVNSPDHYRNLMDPAFTRIGVGVVWSADGSRITTTHRFMQVADAPAPPPPPPPAPAAPPAAPPPAPASPAPAPSAPASQPGAARVSPPSSPSTPAPPTTTTAPPQPVAAASRVSVVLRALHRAAL